ncbi:MAG: putative Na+/H+ antiporter [Puniceicoccales bacterium]|nr:putative Na+/H+ antiporter [Puniceicoccales bacterium]
MIEFIFISLLVPQLWGTDVFPVPLDAYPHLDLSESLLQILWTRIKIAPFNLFATLIFFLAIIHTFFAPFFQRLGQRFHRETASHQILRELCHILGEVEAIFGIWLLPLALGIFYFYDWSSLVNYFHKVNYVEPMFITVIMAIAASRPVLFFARSCMQNIAAIGRHTPLAWWLTIITIGPLLGSFITEPAAMTIAALLLGQQIYSLGPSLTFRYATFGLLLVNVSVGGTLTHFAAPPILMVAGKWHWDTHYMLTHFGLRALAGMLISAGVYWLIFFKEFRQLKAKVPPQNTSEAPIPRSIVVIHLLFLFWTIFNIHTPALFILGFLFFLGFTRITAVYQRAIDLRSPILVGFFLAGLVTHGGLQQWWIQPLLGRMNETYLFLGSTILTAFNDNASITYLASLVPEIFTHVTLQHAVVAGAVTGGGLTLIANAPNPAGQSILQQYFPEKISAIKLFFSALAPTVILALCFNYL